MNWGDFFPVGRSWEIHGLQDWKKLVQLLDFNTLKVVPFMYWYNLYIGTIGRNWYYKLITLASMVLYPPVIETAHVTCSILLANLRYPVNCFFSYLQYCSLLGIAKQAPHKKKTHIFPKVLEVPQSRWLSQKKKHNSSP